MVLLLVTLIVSNAFAPWQHAIIEDVADTYERWLPAASELTFRQWPMPGAFVMCGVLDHSNECRVYLGTTVWSREKSVAAGYPTWGARSDEELARLVIGHELGHLALSEDEVRLFIEMVDSADAEEAATTFGMRVQRIPLSIYEPDVHRRFQMYRWFSAVRRARSH